MVAVLLAVALVSFLAMGWVLKWAQRKRNRIRLERRMRGIRVAD